MYTLYLLLYLLFGVSCQHHDMIDSPAKRGDMNYAIIPRDNCVRMCEPSHGEHAHTDPPDKIESKSWISLR